VSKYLILLCLACSPLTSEEKGKLLKTSIDASRAGCLILMSDKTIPRDEKIEEYCTIALNGCPKLTIKNEVRKVP
jgi:hypothetical protein